MDALRAKMQVVLVETRFPENIGMAARACANMGVPGLAVTRPELWPALYPCPESEAGYAYVEKAAAAATSAGRGVLAGLRVFADLDAALAESTLSFGATARTGGWRQELLLPAQAAELALAHLRDGGFVSFVFGPEGRGLGNPDIERCSHLVNIPTASASSLNLAQAVLLILYEFSRICPFGGREKPVRPGRVKNSPFISHEQSELLAARLKEAMLALESLPEGNSGYFMLPLRRLLARTQLRHNEFSILMGICGNISRLASRGKKA
jgi:tRNA/rRNA methyltransferase